MQEFESVDRNTKHFYGLLKSRSKKKQIYLVKDSENTQIYVNIFC